MDLPRIQEKLASLGLDGWLFYDHHERDPLAYRILGFRPERTPTRRWYYYIPASGDPVRLVHRIEPEMLDPLPGSRLLYSRWSEMEARLAETLAGARRVAMQHSPRCAIPYVAMVDAGTIELVRDLGVDVTSSADLVQYFESQWNQEKLDSHLEAGRRIDRILGGAFQWLSHRVRGNVETGELAVKEWILGAFEENGLFTDHGPIVAVNRNCSNPHYEPTAERWSPIRQGDFVLIDLWAKLARPGSVYYDITWTGYCGDDPPSEMENVFEIVRGARDAAIVRVENAAAAGERLRGFEVDDVARGYIEQRGHGEHFFHRTGHSIGEDVHGTGANMDNLESHDERLIIPWSCFSIEPGIYLENFGVRSEVDMFVGDDSARVTGSIQRQLVII